MGIIVMDKQQQALVLGALLTGLKLPASCQQQVEKYIPTASPAIWEQARQIINLPLDLNFKQPLDCIFERVILYQDENRPVKAMWQPDLWSKHENIFPKATTLVNTKELFDQFTEKLTQFLPKAQTFEARYNGTLMLIDEYLWAIPANATDSDIPLAEVLRLQSAITACLVHQPNAQFTLLVGDLSGIQDYIFGITAAGHSEGGTGRRLRARSMFVQLLAEVAMQKALKVYDLPVANIFMFSGGKFQLLWPNLPDNQTQLDKLQTAIDTWLIDKLNGEIGLNLAMTTVTTADFGTGFGEVFEQVEAALRQSKQRKFHTVLQQSTGWQESNFTLKVNFRGQPICSSCGKFPATGAEGFCRHCNTDAALGGKMRRAKQLVFYHGQIEGAKQGVEVLGDLVEVLTPGEHLNDAYPPYLVLQLGGEARPSTHIPTMWRSPAPYITEDTFDKMGHMLGYFKADVDNLGAIFQWGLKRKNPPHLDTPLRLSTLSRHLDRFFSLWLREYLAKNYSQCYTVFAGGDDLFIIGAWETTTKLALELRQKFAEFVYHNPEITLSAGLALVKQKYPLARAATQAEDTLHAAKSEGSIERLTPTGENGKGRNQIALLGDVLTWEGYQLALEEILKLQQDNPKSAFLYHLMQYAEMWQQYKLKGDPTGLRYMPMLAYDIARNISKQNQPNLWQWANRLILKEKPKEITLLLHHMKLVVTIGLFRKRGKEMKDDQKMS